MNKTYTLEQLHKEAKTVGLSVALDKANNRLVFAASKEEFPAVFHFMDAHKVETDRGMAYPINFAIYSKLKKKGM